MMSKKLITQPPLNRTTALILRELARQGDKLVLAESCTGGLLASLFTEIPGASDSFCGSFVTYRETSKTAWIGVKKTELKRSTAVSRAVAIAMARGALAETPEATIAASITGYLGPSGEKVGLVYFTVLRRGARTARTERFEIRGVRGTPARARVERRIIAAGKLLEVLADEVRAPNRRASMRR